MGRTEMKNILLAFALRPQLERVGAVIYMSAKCTNQVA